MADDAVLKELAGIREELRLLRTMVGLSVSAGINGGIAALAAVVATARSPESAYKNTDVAAKVFREQLFSLGKEINDSNAAVLKERLANIDLAKPISDATAGSP